MAFYTKPLIGLFIVALIIAIALFAYKKHSIAPVFIVIAVLSFIALSFNDVILQRYIVESSVYNKVDTLPDSTDIRILPKAVAFRYLEDSLQKSREKIGRVKIVNLNNSLVWLAPRVPDGAILYLTQKVNGVMTADATKSDRVTKMMLQ